MKQPFIKTNELVPGEIYWVIPSAIGEPRYVKVLTVTYYGSDSYSVTTDDEDYKVIDNGGVFAPFNAEGFLCLIRFMQQQLSDMGKAAPATTKSDFYDPEANGYLDY